MKTSEIATLKTWITESDNIVFFGGAGVSTESGIPDFRGEDGLYRQRYAYPPETIISHSFYARHPEIFFDFYRNRMLYPNAKPNVVHQRLAQWERDGKDIPKIHPTQKPVALCEYFIKTYTRPGELVADICAGSGTTAVAALNTGRRFICFETVPAYYAAASERIRVAGAAVEAGEKGV